MANEFKIKNGLLVDQGGANITGSSYITGSLALNASGSSVFTVDGTSGRLFSVDDSLSGSLFSVNTIAGLPIIEAFSDNTVRIGQYGKKILFISQSQIGIGKETPLNGILDISGSVNITGSINVSGSITGSLFGTSSWATNALTASYVPASGVVGLNLSQISLGVVTASVNAGSNLFSIVSGSNTLMVVDNTGSIGLGTTSPAYKLDVNGAIASRSGSDIGVTISTNPSANAGGTWQLYTIAPSKYAGATMYNSAGVFTATFNYGDSGVAETHLRDAFIVGPRTSTGKLIFIRGAAAIQSMTMFSNGNFLIQDGGTHTDNNYKLDVQGTGRFNGNVDVTGSQSVTGSLNINGLSTFTGTISGSQPSTNPSSSLIIISGSVTAPTGSLSGSSTVLINTIISASANNQQLVAIDINPTFVNGSYTGLKNVGLRIANMFSFQRSPGGSAEIQSLNLNTDFLGKSDNSGAFSFYGGGAYNAGAGITVTGNANVNANRIYFFRNNYVETARFTANGRFLLGTTNESIHLLDVSGSGRFYDNVYVTGSVIATQGFTGSLFGTASWATNALTASSADNFTVRGTLTAQTIVAQTITSSTEWITGSSKFGNLVTDTHQFTGSVSISGSLTVTGSINGSFTGSLLGTAATASYISASNIAGLSLSQISLGAVTASVNTGTNLFNIISGSNTLMVVDNTGSVGLGTTSPAYKLDVFGSVRLYPRGNINGGFEFTYIDVYNIMNANSHTFLSSNQTMVVGAGNGSYTFLGVNKDDYITPVLIGYNSWQSNLSSPSAILDIRSTTKGFLPPRMTAAQRTAISSPARGLLVYDIDSTTEGLWLYNSGSTPGWQEVLTNTGSQSILGGLTATSFTGSLLGTASYATNALTASYFSGSISSAITAQTASYATDFYVSGTLSINSSSLFYQQNLSVPTGSYQVIVSTPTSSYRAAFFDYVMFNGSIARAGTIYSVWSGSYAEYYENYTGDVGGSTAGVTLQAAISGSNIQLQATASNTAWTIRSLVRML